MMRVSKFSPIDRAYPVFEVWDDLGDNLYFEVMASDEGAAQIAFHDSFTSSLILLGEFARALKAAEAMMEEALNSN
jgi:hypothetical protein